jgi:hypothetical protein
MSAPLQGRLREGLGAAGSLLLILTGMSLMNQRVREQLQHLYAGGGVPPDVSASAHHVQNAALFAIDALRDQAIAHAPLTIFALAAAVLLLVMLRT